jgi:O-antigen/teichoic acid export membrane protein
LERIKALYRSDLVRNFFVYSFGALFLKGVSFFLLPLYTKLLSPEEYGILELLSTFSNVLDITLSLGLIPVLLIEYYHYSDENRKKLIAQIISSFLTISTPLYLLVLFFVLVFQDHFFPSVKNLLIVIVMLTSYFTFFQSFITVLLKQLQQAAKVTILQVAAGICSIALNVLFVYGMRAGIDGIIWSSFIAVMLSFIYSCWFIYSKLHYHFTLDKNELKKFLKLGLPFVPNALALWFMNSANRWILLNYTNFDEVGYFSVATKFSTLFEPMIIQPFLSAYTPQILKKFSNGNFHQHTGKIFILAVLFFGLSGFALQLIAGWMIDDKFDSALYLIPILVAANIFSLMAQILANILVFKKKIPSMLISITAGAVVSFIVNFVLVPRYGALGAAIAINVGGIVWLAFIAYFYKKEMRRLASK